VHVPLRAIIEIASRSGSIPTLTLTSVCQCRRGLGPRSDDSSSPACHDHRQIFDFIDGKVAHELHLQSRFGAFWDSTLDRFSDLALLTGLIYLYSKLGRSDYVMVAALTLIFSIMTSYARARAESLVEKCKVGFMERPERIVLFMIGAFTNRMAAVLWVILVLSVLAVANRIYYTYLALNRLPLPSKAGFAGAFNRAFFWTDDRATLAYDLWVIAILAFVWLTPPDWLRDPMAQGMGLLGLIYN
jgi:phosphatidylglycerophosphate synthase